MWGVMFSIRVKTIFLVTLFAGGCEKKSADKPSVCAKLENGKCLQDNGQQPQLSTPSSPSPSLLPPSSLTLPTLQQEDLGNKNPGQVFRVSFSSKLDKLEVRDSKDNIVDKVFSDLATKSR